jgi:hypothetical protein
MDPLAALGLAAAVVQFVDFGIEIFRKSNEILHSASGASAENTSIKNTTSDLQVLLQNIKDSQPPVNAGTDIPAEQVSLNSLVVSCNEVGDELLKLVRDVSAGPGAGKRKSLAAALSSAWSRKQIQEITDMLERYKKQLNMNILVALRYGQQRSIRIHCWTIADINV